MGLQRRGEALRLLGQWEEGARQLRRAQEDYVATGAASGGPWRLAEFARSSLHLGQYEEGLRLVDEALELMNQKTMRFYAAEKYRIKGELVLQQFNVQVKGENPQSINPLSEAEACFLKAIEIARSQKAKSWELRAAT
jgi:tetratricopeptide (TPR) repeat protein